MMIGAVINSVRFTWDAKAKCFITMASDIGDENLSRLYDDSCDVGFQIQSKRTRACVGFYLKETKRDNEGDIECWEYEICPEFKKKCGELTAIVFND